MLTFGGVQRLTLHYDPHWPRSTSSQSPTPCCNSTNSRIKRKVHDWTGDILSRLKAGNSLSSWERPRCWFSTPVDMKVNRTSEFSDLDGWVNIFGNNVHVKTQLHRSNAYLHSWILLFSIFVAILCPIMMILSLNVPQTKAFSWGFLFNVLHCLPHIRQEPVGVGQGAPLPQLQVYIMLQLLAKVVQLQVFLLQIPGETTLQLLQPAV